MEKDAKIYVAGHRGLVGSAIFRRLKKAGCTNLVIRQHAELDLISQAQVENFFSANTLDYVILCAAMVGGIWANSSFPADFIYNNLAIQTNVIHAAWRSGVKRLVFLGSSCIYPRDCPQPIREEYLLSGPLEKTNEPYAVAKIAGIKMCQAYNRQHGTKFISVMPTNLYGPNDNFDLQTSHVLPALIRKFHLGKLASKGDWETIEKDEKIFGKIPADTVGDLAAIGEQCGYRLPTYFEKKTSAAPGRFEITIWGTGTSRREFLHVDDLADACLTLMEIDDDALKTVQNYPGGPLINIGCGSDNTIEEIALLIKDVVGFEGGIRFDTSKPDGTPRKLLDISRLSALGWTQRVALEDGIRKTYCSYLEKYGEHEI